MVKQLLVVLLRTRLSQLNQLSVVLLVLLVSPRDLTLLRATMPWSVIPVMVGFTVAVPVYLKISSLKMIIALPVCKRVWGRSMFW